MIKNYVLAIMLSCAASASFGQMKNLTMTYGTATIDGIKDDSYAPMQDIANCINTTTNACGDIPGATNCTGTAQWSAMTDLDAIYVMVEVNDASAGGAGDGVDFFMSSDNSRITNCPGNWPRAYGLTGFQLEFKSPEMITMASPSGKTLVEKYVGAFKSATTATGYTVEFSILYSEMDFLNGLQVTEGRIIGVDVAVNQNAAKGDGERIAQSMWSATGQDRNWTEPKNFGTLTIPAIPTGTAVNSLSTLLNTVSIAPNPAANQVSVIINGKQQDEVAISIINTLSQKVYSSKQSVIAGETKHEISTSALPNGIYTVVISKGNLSTTEKLVIKK